MSLHDGQLRGGDRITQCDRIVGEGPRIEHHSVDFTAGPMECIDQGALAVGLKVGQYSARFGCDRAPTTWRRSAPTAFSSYQVSGLSSDDMNGWSRETYDLTGFGLWVLGILFFIAAAFRSGDALSLTGSLLFLVGIVLVMVPMVKGRGG